MKYIPGHVTRVTAVAHDIYILKLHSQMPYIFQAGQYCELALQQHQTHPPHFFSIASSPHRKHNLEFCIRTFGDFTRRIVQSPKKSTLYLSSPMGSFTLERTDQPVVFIAGGMGVAPIISMIQYLFHQKIHIPITLLLGNRTRKSILYLPELNSIQKKYSRMRVIHVLSEEKSSPDFPAYEGFITRDIIAHEIDFSSDPIMYLNGPPVFIDIMFTVLRELGVPRKNIVIEQSTRNNHAV